MRKTKRFGMVFTAREQELLKTMASYDGLSESQFMRWLIRDAAKSRGVWGWEAAAQKNEELLKEGGWNVTEAQEARRALDERRRRESGG